MNIGRTIANVSGIVAILGVVIGGVYQLAVYLSGEQVIEEQFLAEDRNSIIDLVKLRSGKYFETPGVKETSTGCVVKEICYPEKISIDKDMTLLTYTYKVTFADHEGVCNQSEYKGIVKARVTIQDKTIDFKVFKDTGLDDVETGSFTGGGPIEDHIESLSGSAIALGSVSN